MEDVKLKEEVNAFFKSLAFEHGTEYYTKAIQSTRPRQSAMKIRTLDAGKPSTFPITLVLSLNSECTGNTHAYLGILDHIESKNDTPARIVGGSHEPLCTPICSRSLETP